VAEERYLVIVDKVAATPNRYPRRVGIPSKRPLHN
jgi:16S rRNA (guanine527-N7)-methyltransferase